MMIRTNQNSPACRVFLPAVVIVCALLASARATPYQAPIDATNRYSWGEQVGWLNHRATHGETTVCVDGSNGYLRGYAWAENAGWMKLGATGGGPYLNTTASNWGVNLGADWNLSGYAWSENSGWVNFQPTHGGVQLDPLSGAFGGYAWGENTGWIHMGDTGLAYRLTASLPQATNGVPQWWLWQYGFTNNFDTVALADADGDGMATWQEYIAATDPTNAGSFLGIRHPDGHDVEPWNVTVTVTWYSVEGKLYDLYRATNLLDAAAFTPLATNLPGQAGQTLFIDTNLPAFENMFYRIRTHR